MEKFSLLFCLLITSISFSQSDSIQVKLDSIVKEADLLYNYEKVAWNSSDLFMSKDLIKSDFGDYLVYHSKDTIFAVFTDLSERKQLAKYAFTISDVEVPFAIDLLPSELSEKERQLFKVKNKVISQITHSKYEVSIPEGFNPNLVLIQEDMAYKLYILMGTTQPGIIPFGNDYLFRMDSKGKIQSWEKFHSRLIPIESKLPTGETVTSASHSHLRTTPYITATDICTFKLYATYTELKEFEVYSPALGKYMKYNLADNSVEIFDK